MQMCTYPTIRAENNLPLDVWLQGPLQGHPHGVLSTEKGHNVKSHELCLIWGKMRTAVQETAKSSETLLQRGRWRSVYM